MANGASGTGEGVKGNYVDIANSSGRRSIASSRRSPGPLLVLLVVEIEYSMDIGLRSVESV